MGADLYRQSFFTSTLSESAWSGSRSFRLLARNHPLYSHNGKVGRLHMPSGRFGEEENLLFLPGISSRFLGRPVGSLVTTPISLSQRQTNNNNTHFK